VGALTHYNDTSVETTSYCPRALSFSHGATLPLKCQRQGQEYVPLVQRGVGCRPDSLIVVWQKQSSRESALRVAGMG
jgi:hypothetical protein